MTTQPPALATLNLSSEELDALPMDLRRKFKDAVGQGAEIPKRWVLVGADSVLQATVMRKTVRTVGKIAAQRHRALSEDNIERLVDLYLEGEQRAEIDDEIELDNAELRAEYLKSVKSYTAADIRARLSKARPKNPSEPASRWKREKRIFAIRHGGSDYFPCFQFTEGAPLPVIRKILKALPDDMTPWQIAFWFASGNGWLDGKPPEDCLSEEDEVVATAGQMRATVIG